MRVSTVSVTGVADSAWLPLDSGTVGPDEGIYVTCGAGCTITVQVTPDDVFDSAVTPAAFAVPVAALVALTASVCAALPLGARAVRLHQTAGAAASKLQVVTQGIR